ncbi:MFS transporter [Sphingomonas sp.]|uniref:MFS transporter n=1 Tax=Sphingomonas sp. TaxID=28214 RepID=UPI00289A42EE|nr:MFS transporter [Sphingomonas sp.]
MISALAPVRTLLTAIFLFMLGAGFLTTLISVRLQASGTSPVLIGVIATGYFAGLAAGALRIGRLVERIGHIRTFSVVVSLLSASTLVYTLTEQPLLWLALRFVDGCCVAGVYVCLESWLNDQAEGPSRGGVLAGYMIALYLGQGGGQQLLNVAGSTSSLPFILASLLISLAVLPVALTRMNTPTLATTAPLSVRRLYSTSPLAIIGVALTGIMLGAFYGLGPVYAGELGLSVADTAGFMTIVILGGVALQWPLGRLSDRFDRRTVIVGTTAGAAISAFALSLLTPIGAGLILAGLFGGASFALYPLCIAHANDQLMPKDRISATGGLVFVYSVGAATGPLIGSSVMVALGPPGLFQVFAVLAGGVFLFGMWRRWAGDVVPPENQRSYQVLPRTTPISGELLEDPADPQADGRTFH